MPINKRAFAALLGLTVFSSFSVQLGDLKLSEAIDPNAQWSSIDVDNDRIAIGLNEQAITVGETTYTGAIQVFSNALSDGIQSTTIASPDSINTIDFGHRVILKQNELLVAAPKANIEKQQGNYTGEIFLYQFEPQEEIWTKQTSFTPNPETELLFTNFSNHIDYDGQTLVATSNENTSCNFHIFEKPSIEWPKSETPYFEQKIADLKTLPFGGGCIKLLDIRVLNNEIYLLHSNEGEIANTINVTIVQPVQEQNFSIELVQSIEVGSAPIISEASAPITSEVNTPAALEPVFAVVANHIVVAMPHLTTVKAYNRPENGWKEFDGSGVFAVEPESEKDAFQFATSLDAYGDSFAFSIPNTEITATSSGKIVFYQFDQENSAQWKKIHIAHYPKFEADPSPPPPPPPSSQLATAQTIPKTQPMAVIPEASYNNLGSIGIALGEKLLATSVNAMVAEEMKHHVVYGAFYGLVLSPCLIGKYYDIHIATCVDSPAGYFNDSAGAFAPVPCSPGRFSNQVGSNSCLQATPGFYVDTSIATAQKKCPKGSYQPEAEATNCLKAPVDTFVASAGATDYQNCPTGTSTQGDEGAQSSEQCVPTEQEPQCETGQYFSEQEEACKDAQPGYFVTGKNPTTATPCAVGYFQNAARATKCWPAPVNAYVDSIAATNYKSCPVNTSTRGMISSSSADDCLETLSISGCHAGYYKTEEGCIAADPGYFVAIAGSQRQQLCFFGTYSDKSASTICLLAPEDTYIDSIGAVTPTACPEGTTTNGQQGSILKNNCKSIGSQSSPFDTDDKEEAGGSLNLGFLGILLLMSGIRAARRCS